MKKVMEKEKIYNNLLKLLPLERDNDACIIHFVKRIFHDYLELIEEPYKNDYKRQVIKEFVVKSIESLEYFFNGDSLSSQNKFHEAIKLLLGDDKNNYNGILPVYNKNYNQVYCQEEGSVSDLFRLTKYEDSMWHIPFEKRHLSSSGRFSAPGMPCLYLGDSIKTCLEELDNPDKMDYFVSCFEFDYNQIVLLDLTMPKIIVGEDENKYYDKAIFSWPLVALCMIKKPIDYPKETSFYWEYLYPQYIMNMLSCEKETKIRAVKYFSVKDGCLKSYNIAIPARKYTKNGYCEDLKNIFKEDDISYLQGHNYKVSKPKKIGVSEINKLQKEISKDQYDKI